jgi:hypothetical protein
MTDFLCERCRYIVDNGPTPDEATSMFQCRFCSEEKGIKVYIDRNYTNEKKDTRITIGWAHLACLFWNNYLEFADETKFEVK